MQIDISFKHSFSLCKIDHKNCVKSKKGLIPDCQCSTVWTATLPAKVAARQINHRDEKEVWNKSEYHGEQWGKVGWFVWTESKVSSYVWYVYDIALYVL